MTPISTTTTAEGLSVKWSDQHESYYPVAVLERASYDPPLSVPVENERIPWGSSIASSPPAVQYDSLMLDGSEAGAEMLHLLDDIVRLLLDAIWKLKLA